eukprot:gnl/TRDRNA2_/TRDRNA2_58219_c0_seq1.p1 gnl/TRDRNA2_/TRDRNA2_58219_c0~~gnl/TRDRNA2_/TRDRNA2_58219_c0_seq1.p1  ORF type:complete len:633 (-),score=126.14 gnl/TRDRNA2_/TRDRNA2_58219_c0_seq1:80-1837(-)
MKRSQEQAVMKAAKDGRESGYFWDTQARIGSSPPYELKPWQLQQEEQEIFGSHDGNVGINFDKYDEISVQMSGEGSEQITPISSFQDLASWYQIPAFLTANIAKCKYTKPTPIQKYALAVGLAQRDAMCCAQTGSGKTCSFLLPIISFIPEAAATGTVGVVVGQPAAPKAIVLAPTRELCSQIHMEARKLTFKSKVRASEVYGGVEAKPQLRELALGSDIVTATPGRLSDFIERGVMTMSQAWYLVLDEADRMLDMGFEPQIRQIVQKSDMPTPEAGRMTLMFSATFPKPMQKLAQEFMRNYIWIGVGQVGGAVDTVEQSFVLANQQQKPAEAVKLLKQNPNDSTLVFVAMKRTAAWLQEHFGQNGISAMPIHGDMAQPEREQSLKAFRSGQVKVLVATDVAARGLDIPKVSHVVNYDLPEQLEDYVHRIGRTGRIGRQGWATSFFATQGNYSNHKILGGLVKILSDAGKPIPDFMQQLAQKSGISWGGGGKKWGTSFGGSDVRGGQTWSTTVSNAAGKGGAAAAAKGKGKDFAAAGAKGGWTPAAGKGGKDGKAAATTGVKRPWEEAAGGAAWPAMKMQKGGWW